IMRKTVCAKPLGVRCANTALFPALRAGVKAAMTRRSPRRMTSKSIVTKNVRKFTTKDLAEKAGALADAAEEALVLAGKPANREKDKESARVLMNILKDVAESAKSLAKEKMDLTGARSVFKELSPMVIALAERYVPAVERGKYNVFYCSMAEAKWLQVDEETRNPYYGKEMPACGERVVPKSGEEKQKKTREEHGGRGFPGTQ
ncbi:MAG: hypothetical protein AB1742_01555, partial [bacterium]